ncbi:TetR/AcrR family transcriptional regulator [Nocardia sp. NPDC127579]|uniref:TetR/AcrR family transcriptional regulator n=1 Tax=Nocardia sp. NPDC127579 TaxID=3345402 RepID=UPI00362AF8EA
MNPEAGVEDRAGRAAPKSKRGLRTRAALIAAAREVFERDGFLDARISDIPKAAGMASGTFYTYFDSKEEIFTEVVRQIREEMLHPHVRESIGDDDPRELIAAANREYLQSYRRNARLMAVLEQVSKVDEKFRTLRRERGAALGERNAAMIRDLQERGLADARLDPLITSWALSSMVGRMAYTVFVEGDEVPFERLVETMNQLWYNALRLGD